MNVTTRMFQLLVLLLVLLVLCAACPSPEMYASHGISTNDSSYLTNGHSFDATIPPEDRDSPSLWKRWYSVWSLGEIHGGKAPWGTDLSKYQYAPWPKKCGIDSNSGHQWVRYCFKNEHSADNLIDIVAHAIVMWMPADQYSAMAIQPDIACYDPDAKAFDYHCVCGPQESGRVTDIDALVIGDGQDSDKESEWATYSVTTVGYDYTRPDKSGRHTMTFGSFNEPSDPRVITAAQRRNELIRVMTHELGHAVGLMHEHQRPDADVFLDIDCRNMKGYDQAKVKIMASKDPKFAGLALLDRLRQVCSNMDLANVYFPEVANYIGGDGYKFNKQLNYPGEADPFDYGSITMYSSLQALRPNIDIQDAVQHFELPMLRKLKPNEKDYSIPGSLVWQGGKQSPSRARISALDIQRVAALYPGTPAKQAAAAGLVGKNKVNWEPKRYSISGLVSPWNLQPAPIDIAYADHDGNIIDNNAAPAGEADAGDVAAAAVAGLALEDETGGQ